jgi:hypothetical protein
MTSETLTEPARQNGGARIPTRVAARSRSFFEVSAGDKTAGRGTGGHADGLRNKGAGPRERVRAQARIGYPHRPSLAPLSTARKPEQRREKGVFPLLTDAFPRIVPACFLLGLFSTILMVCRA